MDVHTIYETVRAATVDGRARNLMYRKKQLLALHTQIAKAQFTDQTKGGLARIAHVLQFVQRLYNDLDPAKSYKLEKAVRNGHEHRDRRRPLGLTVIVGREEDNVFELLEALAAAIAAGNTAILFPQARMEVYKDLLSELDAQAYKVLENSLGDLLSRPIDALVVSSESQALASLFSKVLDANPRVRIVTTNYGHSTVIIHRDADFDLAAKQLLKVFCLGNTNPGAPDHLLVDEFYVDKLFSALQDEAMKQGETGKTNGSPQLRINDVNIVMAEPSSILSSIKAGSCPVIPFTSVDQAIDMVNTLNDAAQMPCAYVFGPSDQTAYMASFLDAQNVYVNAIPLGSVLSAKPSRYPEYCAEVFSFSSPVVVGAPSSPLDKCFVLSSSTMEALKRLTQQKLYFSQKPGGTTNFFVQGYRVGKYLQYFALIGTIGMIGMTGRHFLLKSN